MDQYAGGSARLKVLIVGGPGVGKTRYSSFWPKPIYADCEGGLSSVADRQVPYVPIKNSQDMLDFLHEMRIECGKPDTHRAYKTLVIDTLDAFQRKVQDEYLLAHPEMNAFRGYDAWGYLDAKMQMLMTRLLNLDMNVIVNVHYKDRTVTEGSGESQVDRNVSELQLKGDIRTTAFNDFDLVGWMGSYFEAVDGVRTKKRGLTFVDTPERPFLKDRLFITPPWMEITFSDDDYAKLFSLYTARIGQLEDMGVGAGGEIGEIKSGAADPSFAGNVVGPLSGGPVEPVDPKDMPLAQLDKPTLQKRARELGLTYKNNTIKAELIQMIEEELQRQKDAGEQPAETQEAPAPAVESPTTTEQPEPAAEEPTEAPAEAPAAAETDTPAASPEPEPAPTEPESAPSPAAEAPAASTPVEADTPAVTPEPAAEPVAQRDEPQADGTVVTEKGVVDPVTAEITEPTHDQAVSTVQEQLGGEVISDGPPAETTPTAAPAPAPTTAPVTPAAVPAPAPAASGGPTCDEEGCDTDLTTQNQDWVKLSWIKWRKRYCDKHYLEHKKAA